MSKVEDRAKEIYKGDTPITKLRRKDYCDGYHQAEKDLELTWEDMRELHVIFADVDVDIELCKTGITAETLGYYQEVLKRFKERGKKR